MTSEIGWQTSLFPPEEAPDPLLCWLWLAHTLGPASSHAGRVLDAFGGPQQILFMAAGNGRSGGFQLFQNLPDRKSVV